MWLRLRFDIGWWDCLYAVLAAFQPSPRNQLLTTALQAWQPFQTPHMHSLFTLSVRSGFDLFLRALSLPKGSVVLMSCVTIPDMVRIVEAHGLVARPVDLADDGSLSIDGLNRAFVAKSKVLVVVHLFGCRQDIGEICNWAHARSVLVVEDAAQSFCGPWRQFNASSQADLVLLSFGSIKTATAAGAGWPCFDPQRCFGQ